MQKNKYANLQYLINVVYLGNRYRQAELAEALPVIFSKLYKMPFDKLRVTTSLSNDIEYSIRNDILITASHKQPGISIFKEK